MTTYSTITNGQIDQDSPITQPLMTALRDNPTAIAEGATGAPRIYGNAAATLFEVPILTVSAANTHDIGLAEGVTTGTLVYSGLGLVTAYTISIIRVTGSVRFFANHQHSGGSGSSTLVIAKNGVDIAFWVTTFTGPQQRSADVSVVPGDQITWLHGRDPAAVSNSTVSGQMSKATDGYTFTQLIAQSTQV